MARPSGANVAAASRLCLWHSGPHSVLGARAPSKPIPAPMATSLIKVPASIRFGAMRTWHGFCAPRHRICIWRCYSRSTPEQRQGDLLRLLWSAYDGKEIKMRQRKTGAYVPIPVSDALKTALDAASRKSPIMLVNSDGKPWSESGFQGAWGKATVRAGIRGVTFHDLRGTAVVTLARAGVMRSRFIRSPGTSRATCRQF